MARPIPRLRRTVAVRNAKGESVTVPAGTVPPRWAAPLIRNPTAWEGGKLPDLRPTKKRAKKATKKRAKKATKKATA